MPNYKGNPEFKSRYGEKTDTVRLPVRLIEVLPDLLKRGVNVDDILSVLATLSNDKIFPDLDNDDTTLIKIPVPNRVLRAVKNAAEEEDVHYVEWINNQLRKALQGTLEIPEEKLNQVLEAKMAEFREMFLQEIDVKINNFNQPKKDKTADKKPTSKTTKPSKSTTKPKTKPQPKPTEQSTEEITEPKIEEVESTELSTKQPTKTSTKPNTKLNQQQKTKPNIKSEESIPAKTEEKEPKPSVQQDERKTPNPLNGTQLAKRFGVLPPAISKQKNKSRREFEIYSRRHDPEKLAWNYDPKSGRFICIG